jgi:hypothetical protein
MSLNCAGAKVRIQYFCNFYSDWKKAGKYEDHMRCWEAWNGVIH